MLKDIKYKVIDDKTNKDITDDRYWVVRPNGELMYLEYDLLGTMNSHIEATGTNKRTGLTESEMESLLKIFLCSGELKFNTDGGPFRRYSFKVFDKPLCEELTEEQGKMILKAMDTLRGLR